MSLTSLVSCFSYAFYHLFLDLLQSLSADNSDLFDDKSDDYGSDSGSTGTYDFPFYFEEPVGRVDDSVGPVDDSAGHVDNSIGHVYGVGSGVYFLTGIDPIGYAILLVVFVPIGVESKVVQLIKIFWRSKF